MNIPIVDALHALRPGAEWTLSGTSFSGLQWLDDVQEAPSEAEITAWLAGAPERSLKAYAAAKRFAVETGGIVSGAFGPILTDRATQSMLARTIQSIDLGIISPPIKFKGPAGFVMLDRAALVGISTEVAAHIQAAFDTEGDVVAEIEAGTITTTAQIDAADWPG